MEDVGYALGPAFQKLLEAESLSGTRTCRSIVSLREPPSAFAQSCYQMHPTSVDGILQACGPALWNGNRTNMNAVIIPASIDDIVISAQPDSTTTGMAVVSSSYTGLGDMNETKNYTVDVNVFDVDTGLLLFQLSKLRTSILNTRAVSHIDPIYCSLNWKPDIAFLSPEALAISLDLRPTKVGDDWAAINEVIDLIAFKTPNLNVFEGMTIPDDPTSIWLDGVLESSGVRTAYESFQFAHVDAKALLTAQNKYGMSKCADFSVKDISSTLFKEYLTEAKFELVIIRMVRNSDIEICIE